MARKTDEWIGKTDDQAIPDRVRVRLFERANGRCQACTIKIVPGVSWQVDHITALINGGKHRESNMQVLCGACHGTKTRQDVAEKATTARKRKAHLGLRKKATIQGHGFRKAEPQRSATTPLTKTVQRIEP
jgi:5-methylcytosine-specific restriction enzyme A